MSRMYIFKKSKVNYLKKQKIIKKYGNHLRFERTVQRFTIQ